MDGQRTLESFGYKQELHRSVATVDLLVYGLVFMVPIAPWTIFGTVYNSAVRHGAAGLPHRFGGDGVHGDGLRADGQVVPSRGIGLRIRRPRNPPRRRLFRRMGDPAGLPVGADTAVCVRRRVDDRTVPRHTAVAVGDRVRRRQHRDQSARRRLAEDGQPRVPGDRTGLRRDLRGHRGARHQRRLAAQRRLEHHADLELRNWSARR